MPIQRTYMCSECAHVMEVTLELAQWDAPPPSCPMCEVREMRQEFRPPNIGGSHFARATAMAEEIAANDYHVADMQVQRREGNATKVRYKDEGSTPDHGTAWGSAQARAALQTAISVGKQTRLQHGSSLDIIKEMPDLIAASKKRSARIW